ncbi:iron complex transport system permease protein [Bacillus mesophilus]|uniref:Iron ABC transporter permease n=1 Tax=Bacillus mesophilus TaxID=1808955 RepID=A0A6M0Q759_9BACI|nr:iron ABC transporter permease [Bacillus mesophilus]MBM7661183.1 iron complex transport system permease protein [Bacillus mesophilus]NEY71290.1 iron ABC transporter permease [Bacillus mesophilus]
MQKLYILKSLQNNRIAPYFISGGICFIAIFLGISIGTISIPFSTIFSIFLQELFGVGLSTQIEPMLVNIVMSIRFPRVILAFLVGASLALAGAAFQGLLRNPLADPYTLGVSSGASVGAVVVLFFSIQIPILGMYTLPLFSIGAAFITLILVLSFAKMVEKRMTVETIILTGIIFSSFLGSLISLMIALTGDELRQIISWLLGSVSMRGWEYINLMLPFFIVGVILLLTQSRELNVLSFGEESAQQLGVNVQLRKFIILCSASLLTGASVAVSGTIGFVGLVIPHLTRLLWGANHTRLLPLSMLHGGAFLVLADLTARTIIIPRELPIGVITALIGAPVFAIILYYRKKARM